MFTFQTLHLSLQQLTVRHNLIIHSSQTSKLNVYICIISNTQHIFWQYGARAPRIRNIGISWLSVGIEKRSLIPHSENKSSHLTDILKQNVSHFLVCDKECSLLQANIHIQINICSLNNTHTACIELNIHIFPTKSLLIHIYCPTCFCLKKQKRHFSIAKI
jgi:hypothetical protein